MSSGVVAILGCGRLGSAIIEGWLKTGAVAPERLIILTPSSKPVAEAAAARGARINPPPEAQSGIETLVVAVKPAMWRSAGAPIEPALADDATVVSVMAGVRAGSLSEVFGAHPVARVMPTTGVARARGVASIWAASEAARGAAHDLFDAIAETVDIPVENLMDAVTAVSGSGPAYFHAFTAALAAAGAAEGLPEETALQLARATLRSAASGVDGDDSLDDLIARVASPGGTTRAGLEALDRDAAMSRAVRAAVEAATRRAGELANDA